jgi:hypothetical protein
MKAFHYALIGAMVSCGLATPAAADSVNQPGFTLGLPEYYVLDPGIYVANIAEVGVRKTYPDTRLSIYTPAIGIQTPVDIAGAKLALVVAPIVVDVKTDGGAHSQGFYNTYGGAQLTWKLGNGWGTGFRVGGFVKQGGPVALPFSTIDMRTGVTYLAKGTHFTTNIDFGAPLGSGRTLKPQYLNVDITESRTHGKFEYGAVAFGSSDMSRPFMTYQKQRQLAGGILLGYNFGAFALQARLTSDVYQHNYGGKEQRLWTTLALPIWVPKR